MANEGVDSKRTSRRQFTRAAITAAMAGSLVACKPASPGPTNQTAKQDCPECPAEIKEGTGYTEIVYGAGIETEDHIPPMGLYGGGSITLDSAYKLATTDMGRGPYVYKEVNVADPKKRYGLIKGFTLITETSAKPFLQKSEFLFIPNLGPDLWLWYQDLGSPGQGGCPAQDPDEICFPTVTYPDKDPDVKIKGGGKGNTLTVTIKKKKFDESKSHKTNRAHRFKHGGLAKHFRIGQWRFIVPNPDVTKPDTIVVGGQGDDNYTFYLEFDHYQP